MELALKMILGIYEKTGRGLSDKAVKNPTAFVNVRLLSLGEKDSSSTRLSKEEAKIVKNRTILIHLFYLYSEAN